MRTFELLSPLIGFSVTSTIIGCWLFNAYL
jgi:hypothetical protein